MFNTCEVKDKFRLDTRNPVRLACYLEVVDNLKQLKSAAQVPDPPAVMCRLLLYEISHYKDVSAYDGPIDRMMVPLIWSAKWSIPKMLYIIARYYPLIFMSIHLREYKTTAVRLTQGLNLYLQIRSLVQRFEKAKGGGTFLIAVVNTIFALRVTALYRRSSRLVQFPPTCWGYIDSNTRLGYHRLLILAGNLWYRVPTTVVEVISTIYNISAFKNGSYNPSPIVYPWFIVSYSLCVSPHCINQVEGKNMDEFISECGQDALGRGQINIITI
ncbi:hypothetical protein BDQ17DRAFT_1496257 [Cyathus striatus]|nr:hypothetical protein BDQ17DRAFT_1496257 [Cyathus striatus]